MTDRETQKFWLGMLAPFGRADEIAALDELIGDSQGDDCWGLIADEGTRLLREQGHFATALLFALHLGRQQRLVAQGALLESMISICEAGIGVDYGDRTPDAEWVQRTVGWAMALRRLASDLPWGSGADARGMRLLCGGLELLGVSYDPRQRRLCTTLDELVTEFSETHPQIASDLQFLAERGASRLGAQSSPATADDIDAWHKELRRIAESLDQKLVLHQTRGLQLLARIQLDNIQRVLKPLYERLLSDDVLTESLAHAVRSLDADALLDRHPLQLAAGSRRITGAARKDTVQLYAGITGLMRQVLRLREHIESARHGRNRRDDSLVTQIAQLEDKLRLSGVDTRRCLLLRVLEGQLWWARTQVPPPPMEVIWAERAGILRWVALFAFVEPTTLARFPLEVMDAAASVEGLVRLMAHLLPRQVTAHDSAATDDATRILDRMCRVGRYREARFWLAVVETTDRPLLESTLERSFAQQRRVLLSDLGRMHDMWPPTIIDGDLYRSFIAHSAEARSDAEAGLLATAAEATAAARVVLEGALEQIRKEREARRASAHGTLAAIRNALASTVGTDHDSLIEIVVAAETRLTPEVEEPLEVAIATAVAQAAAAKDGSAAALAPLRDLLQLPSSIRSADSVRKQFREGKTEADESGVLARAEVAAESESSDTAASIKTPLELSIASGPRSTGEAIARSSVLFPAAAQRRPHNNADSLFARGESLRSAGKLDRAESLFRGALQVDKEHQRARAQLALVLHTAERSEEAIQVLEEGLEFSPNHLPYLNQLAVLCATVGDFDKARQYAKHGLQRSETSQQEVGFLTQLELVERRRGNREGALKYLTRLAQLRPDVSNFRMMHDRLQVWNGEELLGSTLGAESASTELLPWELLPERLEVSEFLAEDLRREYVKVAPDFSANETKEKIAETAVRFFNEAISATDRRRPWDEAEKVRTAARLLLDLGKRYPTFDYVAYVRKSRGDYIGENRDETLRRIMSYFASFLGDHHLGHMRMAAARAYFLENFRVYGGLRGFSLSVAEKFIRTWVPEAAQYHDEAKQMVGRDQRRSRDRHRHSPPAVVFQFCLVLEKNWEQRHRLPWMNEFLAGFLDVCRVNDAARGALFHYVDTQGHLVCRAMQLLSDTRALDINTAGPSEWVREALRRQQAVHERIYQDFKYLRENLIRKSRYPEAIQLLGRIGNSYSAATDMRRIERTQDILRIAERFYSATGFQEKGLLASEMQLAIRNLESEIQAEPTELSRVELGRVLFLASRDIEAEFDAFKKRSLPVLSIQVLRSTQTASERVRCDVQIDNLGLSPANEAVIEFRTVDDGRTIGRLELSSVMAGHANATVRKLDLALSNLAPEEAIDVNVVGKYADVDGNEHMLPDASVRVSLGSRQRTFEKIKNPYITGPKVTKKELFKGRDRLIDEILQEVTNPEMPGAVVMYGQKRSGKSSVLYWIEQRAPEWIVPVTIDIHSIFAADNTVQTLLYFWAEAITDKASRRCGESLPSIEFSQLSNPAPTIGFSRFLQKVNEALGPERRLLLLLDEFTDLTARIDRGDIAPGVLRYLKSLIEKGTFSCVLCGVDSMPKVLKTYGNDFAVANTRLVTHLDPVSARELVERPIQLADGTNRFTPLASNAIIGLAGSYPYFIQLICHRLVEYLNNEQNPDPTITRADVDQCVRQIVEGKAQVNPWITFDSLCRYREDVERDTYLTVLEGWLLYLIADEMRTSQYVPQEILSRRIGAYAKFVSADEVDTILNDLVDRDVLAMPPATSVRQFRLVVELFSRWCAANRPMDEQAMLAFGRKLKRLGDNVRRLGDNVSGEGHK
ncbi:tetratricopeptide repeat protein [Sorangium sp. So ce1182]|uniref:tetratricopeptide repeat protein n=1 Tax=Sorangium sp. So ce1182 TaxID=3133334 RepID=UPI003F6321F6